MSQSMSNTIVMLESPILADWLSENREISINAFAAELAENINGDGSGLTGCSMIGNIHSFAKMLCEQFGEEDAELCDFVNSVAEELDNSSVAKIFCVGVFPGDAPEFCRLIYQNGFTDYECVSWEEIDEELAVEVLSDLMFVSPYDFVETVTARDIDKIINLVVGDDFMEYDEDEE